MEDVTTVPTAQHEWIPSRLGHGEVMCKYCFITNREAAVLGILNWCVGRKLQKESTKGN